MNTAMKVLIGTSVGVILAWLTFKNRKVDKTPAMDIETNKSKIENEIMPIKGVNGIGVVERQGIKAIEISVNDPKVKKDIIRIIETNGLDQHPIYFSEDRMPIAQ